MAAHPSMSMSIFLILLAFTTTYFSVPSASVQQRPLIANLHSARSLLTGGEFPIFLRRTGSEQMVAVELSVHGTVKDLYETAAQVFGVDDARSLELQHQGEKIEVVDWHKALADTGISAEVVIEVHDQPHNDVVEFLAMFADDQLSEFFTDSFRSDRRIKAMNEEVLRGDADISEVVQMINYNSLGGERGSVSISLDASSRINRIEFDYIKHDLDWSHLPKKVEYVQVYGGKMTQIDFTGIQCDNLQWMHITHCSRLKEVQLAGIDRCASLRFLRVGDNIQLDELQLEPLRGCRALKELVLDNNHLQQLHVSAICDLPLLRSVSATRNAFDTTTAEQIDDSLHCLKERDGFNLYI